MKRDCYCLTLVQLCFTSLFISYYGELIFFFKLRRLPPSMQTIGNIGPYLEQPPPHETFRCRCNHIYFSKCIFYISQGFIWYNDTMICTWSSSLNTLTIFSHQFSLLFMFACIHLHLLVHYLPPYYDKLFVSSGAIASLNLKPTRT